MSNFFYTVLFALISTTVITAQPTFTEDVAPIIYDHCTVCHRDGEIGPMPLTNYEEVSTWANTIKYVTEIKYMPPWKANPSYSKFLDENYLRDDQIQIIADWVDSGMIQGDTDKEPPLPDFPEGSALGTPDLVLTMDEAFMHKGNNQDNYRYFVLPSGLTEDKVVKAMEFRPGNAQIVHHALVFEDLTGAARANDAATPEYGFDGFGSFAGDDQESILEAKQYPGYVPGQKARFYPEGLGQVLHAGADVVVQLHYAPWSVDATDQSSINIFFADDEEVIEREVDGHIMVPFPEVINELFLIAPNTYREFHGQYVFPNKVSLTGIAPHMHLLGKTWRVYIERKNGDIVNLIRIDEWDFNWQGSFAFDRFIVAEQGDVLHAFASYDNRATNPNNPSNPPQYVSWGENTTDEMFYLPITFVPYKTGDENITFGSDSTSNTGEILSENGIYQISPNPVSDYVNAQFHIETGQSVSINIVDVSGRIVRKLRENEYFHNGDHIINFDSTNLAEGTYFLNIKGADFNTSQSFVRID